VGLLAATVWQDDFNQLAGSALDPSRWTYDRGDRWHNAELQRYTDQRENSCMVDDPEATDGNALVIRAVREGTAQPTSARLKTQGKFAATYGRAEAHMKLPKSQGICPAFSTHARQAAVSRHLS
jgi:beta-glucanase (GH16 family)